MFSVLSDPPVSFLDYLAIMSSVFKSALRVAHTRSQAAAGGRTSRARKLTPASTIIRCFSASSTPAICQSITTLPIRGTDPLRGYVGVGSAKRLPEFSLQNKVVVISGGVGGVGLHQSEALMEAGATGRSPKTILFYQSRSI